ncbi:SusD/RagB family nutrient-binding outer membrane lipoprotein [Algivirga pacifica]|uniref:SusD/RagB family nutrient-binding outer membrane lipoprotein n=1 Tax=Algivirga pacifica TaxID=1162670 RepID=A0ABP9DN32_9BACT
MKNILRKMTLVAAATSSLFLSSCDEGFTEMNIDPNNPTTVPASNLVTQAQFSLNNLFWGGSANYEFGMLMVQHFGQNEYAEESRYNFSASNFNLVWNTTYSRGLMDLKAAKDFVEADENLTPEAKANQLAVIKVLTTWAFHNLTDMYGDIPFSQALNADEYPSPAYDAQSDIYPQLIADLEAAVSEITPGAEGFGSADVIYEGDMAKWQKFANSLIVKIAMRMSDKEDVSSTVASAVSRGVITDTADDANFVFAEEAALSNPMWYNVNIDNRDDYSVSETLLMHLAGADDTYETADDDPRLSKYAKKNSLDAYKGMPYGLTDAASFSLQTTTSRPTDAIREMTAPAIMLSAVEMNFFLAEAVQRGMISGDAEMYYNDAVQASMAQWGVDQADADAYLAAHPYDAANYKEVIGTEKWVALYSQGLEAWAEWRRLDYPMLSAPADMSPVATGIPTRALYPSDEIGTNGDNRPEEVNLNQKLWWDAN